MPRRKRGDQLAMKLLPRADHPIRPPSEMRENAAMARSTPFGSVAIRLRGNISPILP
jgi:hypothetical protein